MQARLMQGKKAKRAAWPGWADLDPDNYLPQQEISARDKSLQRPFRRRTAKQTPAMLIRDYGTPEKAAKIGRWSQPLEEREMQQPELDLPPWGTILPPEGPHSKVLPAQKLGRLDEFDLVDLLGITSPEPQDNDLQGEAHHTYYMGKTGSA